MGADLILSFLPCADTTKEGRRKEFASLVDGLSKKDLEGCPAFADAGVERTRKVLRGHFDQIEKLELFRDVNVIAPYEDKPPLLITGGLSWGDYATESSEPISSLAAVPGAYELFEGWAIEDMEEGQQCQRSG